MGVALVGAPQVSEAGHGASCRCGGSSHHYRLGSRHSYGSAYRYTPRSYGYSPYSPYGLYRPYSGSGFSYGSPRFSISIGSGYSPRFGRYGYRSYGRGCRWAWLAARLGQVKKVH